MFTLARVDPARLVFIEKGPPKDGELRRSRPIARREEARLAPIAERTGIVDKWARRVRRAGKVRLFRLWKIFGSKADAPVVSGTELVETCAAELTRPVADRLAWPQLRRTRRL